MSDEDLAAAEANLRHAMLHSDTAVLDQLLDDSLIFTSHTGAILTKNEDLAVHRDGSLRITEFSSSDELIRVRGDTGIVSVLVALAGSYLGTPFHGDFRYTRVWHKLDGRWRVIAAHCSAVS